MILLLNLTTRSGYPPARSAQPNIRIEDGINEPASTPSGTWSAENQGFRVHGHTG